MRKRRKELGIIQLELAKKTGITREHVVVLEKGRKLPRADLLGRIAKVLGVREDYFFYNDL
ncbi:MAG: helix-turn-helix transcriptional regulator [Nitrospinae bacterium]|nr:helix-turn-helix transcriptional regulator [Nitrospinota bacterium]